MTNVVSVYQRGNQVVALPTGETRNGLFVELPDPRIVDVSTPDDAELGRAVHDAFASCTENLPTPSHVEPSPAQAAFGTKTSKAFHDGLAYCEVSREPDAIFILPHRCRGGRRISDPMPQYETQLDVEASLEVLGGSIRRGLAFSSNGEKS
jgi:hypothetical protein